MLLGIGVMVSLYQYLKKVISSYVIIGGGSAYSMLWVKIDRS